MGRNFYWQPIRDSHLIQELFDIRAYFGCFDKVHHVVLSRIKMLADRPLNPMFQNCVRKSWRKVIKYCYVDMEAPSSGGFLKLLNPHHFPTHNLKNYLLPYQKSRNWIKKLLPSDGSRVCCSVRCSRLICWLTYLLHLSKWHQMILARL